MIEQYNIHNFKIHGQTDLKLSMLTILTGMNGMGKSSVIQSMLMLRESALKKELSEILNLSGDGFNVGFSSNLVNANTPDRKDILEIEITQNGGDEECKNFTYTFQYPTDATTYLTRIDGKEQSDQSLPLFTNDFQYLSAFRHGPLDTYGLDDQAVKVRRQISKNMGRGELVAAFLEIYGNESIPAKELCYDNNADDTTLRTQVGLWLNDISPETALRIDREGNSFKLKYGYKQEGKAIKWIDAMNTGFGISYCLALLVAILSARPGALIVIENPEAHIHPAAQAAFMSLVCKAASAGIQIIIETHSDHIINGALVGLKRKVLKHSDLSIYFFTRDYDTANALACPLTVNELTCRISDAPDGFFTQMKSDMEILFGFDEDNDE